MGSYASRGGGGSTSQKAERILSPSTRQDFIERAEFIASVSSYGGRKYTVSTSDWEKNGKNRTYININEYDASDGKFRAKKDMGYFDNVSNSYVSGRGGNNDLNERNVWNLAGSKKYGKNDIEDFLKTKK